LFPYKLRFIKGLGVSVRLFISFFIIFDHPLVSSIYRLSHLLIYNLLPKNILGWDMDERIHNSFIPPRIHNFFGHKFVANSKIVLISNMWEKPDLFVVIQRCAVFSSVMETEVNRILLFVHVFFCIIWLKKVYAIAFDILTYILT